MAATERFFVGRTEELADLAVALDAAAAGRGALYLVAGEPGIGKTRLADELAARAADSGTRVLWGRCLEAEGRPPYWPWVQIVRSLAPPARVGELGGTLGLPLLADVARLVPELRTAGARVPAATPESEAARFQLFDATTTFLRQVAATTPLLLVLDDLHSADVPSLRLLDFVSRTLVDARILMLGTYRHVEARLDPTVSEIFAALSRSGSHVSLTGLSEPEVGLFIAQAAGGAVPDGIVRTIHRETDGNPFFVDEVVRLLRAQRPAQWTLPATHTLAIPQGVRGAVRQRLAPLTMESRRLLSAAAVIGRELEPALLQALCGVPMENVLAALAAPLEREVIVRVHGTPERYRFTHALVRETLYEELPPAERIGLHRALGEILERRHAGRLEPHLPALAHHYGEAAGGGDATKGIEYAAQAGRQAMHLLAYEEAAEQFGRALRLIDAGPFDAALDAHAVAQRECELLLALGEAQSRAGQRVLATATLRRAVVLARRLQVPARLAEAALRLCGVSGLFWTEFGRSDQALVRVLEEALTVLGDDHDALRARVLARLATELCWSADPSPTDALSRAAVEVARRAGESSILAYALLARMLCVSGPESIDERRANVDEILALGSAAGDHELVVNALMWRIGDALQLGDMATSDAASAALMQLVKELRQPADLWIVAAVESVTALLEGRFADVERLALAILSEPTHMAANAEQMSSALLFFARREQGRLTELEPALKALVHQYPDVTVWRASLALLYREIERGTEAHAEMTYLTRTGVARIRRDLTWPFTMACLSEACAYTGSSTSAAPLYEALLPYARLNVIAGPFYYMGPMTYYLGLLATRMERWREAEAHFEEAAVRCNAVNAPAFLARVQVAHARMRDARDAAGDATAAAALRAHARAIASTRGMTALERAIDDATPNIDRTVAARDQTAGAVLRREGDYWTVAHGERVCRLRDAKGFRYLARLAQAPGREFHVLDLVGTLRGGTAAAVGRRVADLRAEIDAAERNNDALRAGAAQHQIEALTDQVAAAVGLGGRDPHMRAESEKARASVTKAIRSAIGQIATHDPPLARVLTKSVRTGTFCAYEPLPGLALRWEP